MKLKSNLYALPAGQGDCLMFQFQNKKGEYYHILIDGGNRTKVEFKKLKKIILEILNKAKRKVIDLAIITHSDDDHISGILNMLDDQDMNPLIEKIWFNSEKTINEFFKTENKNTQNYKVHKKSPNRTVKSSRIQDNDLYDLLMNDKRWEKDIIYTNKKEDIENLTLTVLSPTIEKLEKLNQHWPTQKARVVKSSSKGGFDYSISYEEYIKNMPDFIEDTSPVNGASIALLLEWESKKILLLSDAHPSVIVESLSQIIGTKDFIEVDVVKISHHGSRRNTSDELLQIIKSNHFIISANANKKHFHPNKETLCRIIKNKGLEDTKFYFTCENNDLRNIFINEPFVKVVFPSNREHGVCFSYEY